MISISIIEDEFVYRKMLKKIIENNVSFEIKSVYSNAEEALANLPTDQPDIVLVDIMLAQMSGIDLIRKIRKSMPYTKFLMCTTFENEENILNAIKAGASGYLIKDSKPENIYTALFELYEGGSPMTPSIARKVIEFFHQEVNADIHGVLTERELEVLGHLSKGLLYKEISEILGISTNTVKNHCKNIYKRLNVANKVEALNVFNKGLHSPSL